jgi:hypothetical protein
VEIMINSVSIARSTTATAPTWHASTPATHSFAAVNAPRHAAFTYANKYGSSGTWRNIG